MNVMTFVKVKFFWISTKFSITDKFSMANQISSNQSTEELAMTIVNTLGEMHNLYVIFSNQFISPSKLKTYENGSIENR